LAECLSSSIYSNCSDLSIQSKPLDWSSNAHIEVLEGPFDVIVGSDVLVFPTTIPSLVHVLSILLLPHAVCYIGSPTERAGVSIFLALMADTGCFNVEEIQRDHFNPDFYSDRLKVFCIRKLE
jgi:hypothetical protein